ncbi:hypothetical protein E2C01_049564 [Portunus trituberculatus]|uniref:Uncharacterized protein n=1 Tax=Portunus trituberculatus TaxID=210409 RepID=A0A5B7G6R7_PORTR|nr:hypothetical protein [Portunus trituberculatus]
MPRCISRGHRVFLLVVESLAEPEPHRECATEVTGGLDSRHKCGVLFRIPGDDKPQKKTAVAEEIKEIKGQEEAVKEAFLKTFLGVPAGRKGVRSATKNRRTIVLVSRVADGATEESLLPPFPSPVSPFLLPLLRSKLRDEHRLSGDGRRVALLPQQPRHCWAGTRRHTWSRSLLPEAKSTRENLYGSHGLAARRPHHHSGAVYYEKKFHFTSGKEKRKHSLEQTQRFHGTIFSCYLDQHLSAYRSQAGAARPGLGSGQTCRGERPPSTLPRRTERQRRVETK